MKALIFAVMGFGLYCCGGNDEGKPEEQKPVDPIAIPLPTTLSCQAGTRLTYENFGRRFLLSYCVSCHASSLTHDQRVGAPVEVNLDRLEDAVVHRQKILDTVVSNQSMPPSERVSEEERLLLTEWLGCGAPGP